MSTMDINKAYGDENKTLDKKQIEEDEKEVMLKAEEANSDPAELKTDDGPVKTALSGDITEQGREVKPKFIPIGAIKMPGFFTKNSDKDKSKDDEAAIEKDTEHEKSDETSHIKEPRFQFLNSMKKFFRHSEDGEDKEDRPKVAGLFNIKYPKVFQKRSVDNTEVTLASMETLDDKIDTPNDGMETVKLETPDAEADVEDGGKVITQLPLKERIRKGQLTTEDLIVCVLILLAMLTTIVCILVGVYREPQVMRPLRLGRFVTTFTSCGPVEGIWDEGVYKFYSIPYAVPPVQERRFTYAQSLNNISHCWSGTLNAVKKGPLCLQFLENVTITGEENCLTLDVVTPHVSYDTPLPVVVLIGANSLTGGISPAQPSALYARTKEVVFVRPNFRLGPFGFLALDILSNSRYPQISGNYGLSDLLAALQWVHLNIKHFGGDPESVTLLGHRAGATLTAALTTVNQAQKLYSRVWLSSPSVIFPGEPLDQSQQLNARFKDMTKCNDAECLRRISTTEILTPDIWLESNMGDLPKRDESKHSLLVLDGEMLRIHAYDSWKEAKLSGKEKVFKPIVFGTTQHSSHSDLLQKKHLNWTAEIVEKMINDSVFGEKNLTSSIFTHVNTSYKGLVELISSVRTLCPLVSLARMRLEVPLYVVMGSGAGGGVGGSGIAGINADVEAILGTFDSAMPEQRRFMSAMQHMFYYFVWRGRLPGPESSLLQVGQDLLPLNGIPLCDLLIKEDIVPRYAHID